MNLPETQKNILLFVLIFTLLGGGYRFFFGGDSGDEALVSEDAEGSTSEAGRELLVLSAKISSITLDESIFSDPAFTSLQDFSQELVPEPIGRRNPFAPLGVGGGQGTTTTTTGQ